jgi:hypothetical protein
MALSLSLSLLLIDEWKHCDIPDILVFCFPSLLCFYNILHPLVLCLGENQNRDRERDGSCGGCGDSLGERQQKKTGGDSYLAVSHCEKKTEKCVLEGVTTKKIMQMRKGGRELPL